MAKGGSGDLKGLLSPSRSGSQRSVSSFHSLDSVTITIDPEPGTPHEVLPCSSPSPLAEANEYGTGAPLTRTVKLKRGLHGYGMYLRETVPDDKREAFVPSEKKPSTQLIIDVDEGGEAQKAGLKAGDFVLEVNNEDVRKKSHDELLTLIGSLQTEVNIKIMHVPKFKVLSLEAKKLKKETEEKLKEEMPPPPEEATPSSTSRLKAHSLGTDSKDLRGSISPSSRRRRIKVLPISDKDELRPNQVFIESRALDPNAERSKNLSKVPQPVRLLPEGFDPGEIFEGAKRMKERREEAGIVAKDAIYNEFLPEAKPTLKDPNVILETIKGHPLKWDVHQTGMWIKSLGLPDSIVEIFSENQINGEHLNVIDKTDLESINIKDSQHQSRILDEIKKVLQKYNTNVTS